MADMIIFVWYLTAEVEHLSHFVSLAELSEQFVCVETDRMF